MLVLKSEQLCKSSGSVSCCNNMLLQQHVVAATILITISYSVHKWCKIQIQIDSLLRLRGTPEAFVPKHGQKRLSLLHCGTEHIRSERDTLWKKQPQCTGPTTTISASPPVTSRVAWIYFSFCQSPTCQNTKNSSETYGWAKSCTVVDTNLTIIYFKIVVRSHVNSRIFVSLKITGMQ